MQERKKRSRIIGISVILIALITAVIPVFSASQTTITLGYSSFEEPALGTQYTDTGSALVDHALSNNTGESAVNYTSTGGELGFASAYVNSRSSTGLTDGDDVGVTNLASSYSDGTQGFQLSDTDGQLTVSMDAVDLSGVTSPEVSIDYFVGSTSWETDDVIRIWVLADGSTEIDLLNTTGQDVDNLGIENSWTTLTQDLTGYNTAVLYFSLDSNSGLETVHIDNIIFTGLQTNEPLLSVSQSVTEEPLLAGQIEYDITIANIGDTPVADRGYNLTITDTLGAGISLISADPSPTFIDNQTDGTTLLIWENIADLEANEELALSVTAELSPTLTSANQFSNQVEATFNDAPDNSGEWITDSETITHSPQAIDIQMTANQSTADEQATGAGEYDGNADWPYSYTISVENNNVGDTDNVTATITLPPGVAYMGNPQISPNPNSSPVTPSLTLESDGSLTVAWSLGTLTTAEYSNPVEITFDTAIPYKFRTSADTAAASGPFAGPMSGAIIHEDAVMEVPYEATGTYAGSAVADGTETSPNDDAEVVVIAEYLTVHKGVSPSVVGIGNTVTYNLDFYVSEYYTVTNAYMVDILPDGLTYTDGSASVAPSIIEEDTPGPGQTTLTWNLANSDTEPGESGTITFDATVDATYEVAPYTGQPVVSGDSFTNQVTIYDDWTDVVTNGRYGTTTPDTSRATITTVMPTFTKDVQHAHTLVWGDSSPAFVGDTVKFRLSYDAAANVDAKEIIVRDFLPRGMTYVASSDVYNNSGTFSSSATCTSAPTSPVTGTLNGLQYVEWRLCNTDMGSSWEVTIDALVGPKPDVEEGWIVANLGKLSGQNTYGDAYSLRDLANVEYDAPNLVLTKSASPNVGLEAGDVVTFTIALENTGPATAYNIVLTDTLPADILVANSGGSASPSSSSYSTVSGNPSAGDGGVIVWSQVSSLDAGQTLTYQYSATIPSGIIAGQSMTNLATVGYNSRPDNAGHATDGSADTNDDNTDDETVYIRGLTVEKSANAANATIGDVVSWTITGTIPNGVTGFWPVIEENNLPNGFDYVSGSTSMLGGVLGVSFDPAHGSTPYDNSNVDLRWFLSPITNTSGVEQTFSLSFDTLVTGVKGNDINTTYYTCCNKNADNDAYISWYDDISGYNNTGSAYDSGTSTSNFDRRSPEADADIRIYQPNLTLDKSSDFTYILAGGVLLFDLEIRNNGNAPAYDVTIVDQLPAELAYDQTTSVVVSPNNGEVVIDNNVAASQNLTYTVDVIPVGTVVNIQYAVDVDPALATGLEIENVAQITEYSTQSGVPSDSNGDTLADERSYVGPTDSVTLYAPVAEIFKEAELNGELTIGNTIVYSLTVPASPLNSVTQNVLVTDVVDPALEVVNVTNGNFTGNVVTATFSTIGINSQEVIVIEAIVPTDTTGVNNSLVLNDATLDYDFGPDHTSNSTAHTLLIPALSIEADVNTFTVSQGDTLTYTLTVENHGYGLAKDFVISSPLPSNMSFVPGSATLNGQSFSDPVNDEFNLGSELLWFGQTAVITFRAQIDSVAQGEAYEWVGAVTGNNSMGLPIPADSSASVLGDPDLDDEDDVTVYGPLSCTTESTNIAYEDLKNTGWSDWDYNDLIVRIDTELCITTGNDLGIVNLDYLSIARGAGFTHNFYHDLPVVGSGRYELTVRDHNGAIVSQASGKFEDAPDFEIFGNTKAIFEETTAGCNGDFTCLSYVNTFDYAPTYRDGYTAELTVLMDDATMNPTTELGETPWDPYIGVFDTGEEVHRVIPGHLNNTQTVNSQHDPNSPLLNEDLPLVQTFDVTWDWPLEFSGIWLGYPDYVDFIKTGGTTNTDWYLEENREDTHLWSHSPFFILGQAARVLMSEESGNNSRYFASPVVADINGDGEPEIIMGNLLANQVEVYNKFGQLLWTQDVNDGVKAAVAVGDIDTSTAGLEILVPSEDGHVYAFHADGTAVANWPVRVGGAGSDPYFRVLSTPAVGNIDNDADLEVIVSGSNGRLYVFSHDGNIQWEASIGDVLDSFGSQVINSSPVIADLDEDGEPEILVGAFDNKLYAFDKYGNELWTFEAGDVIMSIPVVADIDTSSDGNEVVIGSGDTYLYLLDESGEEIWSYATGWSIRSSALIIDMDDNGDLEIIIGSDDHKVYAFNHDGSLVIGWPRDTGAEVFSSPAVGDVDGDGDDEIVIGSDDGYLYAWDMNGTAVDEWPINQGSSVKATPVIIELDNDSEAEVVIGNSAGQLSILGGLQYVYLPIVIK